MGFFSKFLPDRPAAASRERWLVIDVETTGLDIATDHLLAIAGVGLICDYATGMLTLAPADSFEVNLRFDAQAVDRDNILIHGIGIGRQRAGVPPAEALQQFIHWVGDGKLLAFHAGFDRALIARHTATYLSRAAEKQIGDAARWACIEELSAAAYPKSQARSLDEWMAQFKLRCAHRHQAAADALVEAQVLQRIWPQIRAQTRSWSGVKTLAGSARWLGR